MDRVKNMFCDWYIVEFAYVESNKNSMLVDHEKNALFDGYIVKFIHDAT